MKYTVNVGKKPELSLIPETAEQEIIQNLYTLLNTVKGEVPLYRDFGINFTEIRSMPLPMAETALVSEIYDAIEKFEPRAKILNIEIEAEPLSGKLIPVLEVDIKNV